MNQMNFLKISLVPLLSVTLLGGCSVGQTEFNCSGGDNNALCGSSRTIYKAADGELQTNEVITVIHDGEAKQVTLDEFRGIGKNKETFSDEKGVNKIKPNNSALEKNTSNKIKFSVPPQFAFDGNVLREATKVMRIWIAPWTDKSDDLHLSSLIYTDIENRKWNILNVSEKNTRSFVKPHLGNVETDVKTNGEVNLNGMEVRDKKTIERRFESLPKRQQ